MVLIHLLLKRRKDSSLADNKFAAFVVKTLGPWSMDSKKLYETVASRLVQATGNPKDGTYFAQRIALTIQRGYAPSFLGTLPNGPIRWHISL